MNALEDLTLATRSMQFQFVAPFLEKGLIRLFKVLSVLCIMTVHEAVVGNDRPGWIRVSHVAKFFEGPNADVPVDAVHQGFEVAECLVSLGEAILI